MTWFKRIIYYLLSVLTYLGVFFSLRLFLDDLLDIFTGNLLAHSLVWGLLMVTGIPLMAYLLSEFMFNLLFGVKD